ncbi:M24 family metallopeptidase [Streptomyces sp. NPDC058457]|uniref:M24 family metallopeptidase n=1 Tax=Streptomyces sp. NPDC058457 TaxID=3346507 RepID=UPI003646CBE9
MRDSDHPRHPAADPVPPLYPADRLRTAQRATARAGLDALLISPGADLRYLTGYDASPHHELSDRTIRSGDPVVVDIGGTTRDGYCSDSTRVYAVGEPPAAFRRLHEVLLSAQRAQTEAVRPGITAGQLDAVGRDVITDAGYGACFIHRTGHGIGLESHEDPYIVAGNPLPLAPGMAFSVEPGIDLPDRHGARIEDIVICTERGGERLNRTPRDLVVLP